MKFKKLKSSSYIEVVFVIYFVKKFFFMLHSDDIKSYAFMQYLSNISSTCYQS